MDKDYIVGGLTLISYNIATDYNEEFFKNNPGRRRVFYQTTSVRTRERSPLTPITPRYDNVYGRKGYVSSRGSLSVRNHINPYLGGYGIRPAPLPIATYGGGSRKIKRKMKHYNKKSSLKLKEIKEGKKN